MEININDIKNHRQIHERSCVPMAVELVLKLLNLMPDTDFSLQLDLSKHGQSDWIQRGFTYPLIDPKVLFTREYHLSDIGKKDRGDHFMKEYFDSLFNIINEELNNNRYIIISLETGPSQWHVEVVYDKINEYEYKTVTFYYQVEGPQKKERNLKQLVTNMKGTDILIYNWINE